MMKKYKILIIGAGKIAAFFDTPDSNEVLTHAHAIRNSNHFELAGFFDIITENAQKAAKLWGGVSFYSIEEAMASKKIDGIVIAVPDNHHYATLKEIVKYPLKFIITEKPLSKTIEQAEEIRKIYDKKDTIVTVNYSRRFLPEFDNIKRDFENGTYGQFISGIGYYGKGILHNGSHMIDLIQYILGKIKDYTVIAKENDFYPDDPSVTAILKMQNNGNLTLAHINCKLYAIFELDLIFSKKRIRIINSGFEIEMYDVETDPLFTDYKMLVKKNTLTTKLNQNMSLLYESLYDTLKHDKVNKCTIVDAFESLRISLNLSNK